MGKLLFDFLFFFVPWQHLLPVDPLPDGAVCKLGLREGCLPNAKIRGHQVEGGAGASWHPLHPLKGASQRLHVKGQRETWPCLSGPFSPTPSLFSCCLSLCHPLPREVDGTSGPCLLWCHWCVIRQCGLEGTSYKPLQSQTAIQIIKKKKKPCYLSYGLCFTVILAVYCIILFCDTTTIVRWIRIRGCVSFLFVWFFFTLYNLCMAIFCLIFWCYCMLWCIFFFISEGSTRA